MYYLYAVKTYEPRNAQESADKANMLRLFELFPDNILLRQNKVAHITSSGFILNHAHDKVLFVYHNIYKSWSWTGGHADGNGDLLQVAVREAKEETGLTDVRPMDGKLAAIDILPVKSHWRHGKFVSAHVHLNLTFFLEADDREPLKGNPGENQGAAWLPLFSLNLFSTEPHMHEIYQKLVHHVPSV